MIFLLFILLTVLLILNYYIYKNILMPSFIMCMSFWLVSFIYLVCSYTIYETINVKTIIIIVFSILFFSCGEIIGNGLINRGVFLRYQSIEKQCNRYNMDISTFTIVFFVILILVSAHIRMVALCTMVKTEGNIKSFISSYAQIRFFLIHGSSPIVPKWVSYMPIIATCIVRICITVFSYNFLKYHIVTKKYFFVIAAFILFLVTSTSRTVYLDLMVYIVFQFFFLQFFLYGKIPMIKWKTIKPIIIGGGVFVVCFMVIGNMAEKSIPMVENIFAYSAASFIGLDIFLKHPYYAKNILNSRTLQGLFSPLDRFGLQLPKIEEYLPHYYYLGGKCTSNEYTSLMEPIHDFGLSGLFLSRVILGLIFGILFGYIVKQGNKENKYCLIPMLVPIYYSLVLSSIDDQFSNLIGMYYIYQLFFTWMIWKMCVVLTNNIKEIRKLTY